MKDLFGSIIKENGTINMWIGVLLGTNLAKILLNLKQNPTFSSESHKKAKLMINLALVINLAGYS